MATFAERVWLESTQCHYDAMVDEQSLTHKCDLDNTRMDYARVILDIFYTYQGAGARIHVTKAKPREKLHDDYSHSYVGFLIKDLEKKILINQLIVQQEVKYFSNFGVIACFVGSKPQMHRLTTWLAALHQKIEGSLVLGCNFGKGFRPIV